MYISIGTFFPLIPPGLLPGEAARAGSAGASERGPPQRRGVAAEGAAVAGLVLLQAWWAVSGGIARGDSAALEVEVAAEPSGAILCPGLAWLNQELV